MAPAHEQVARAIPMIGNDLTGQLAALLQPRALVELLVLAACLALAWGAVRLVRGRQLPDQSIWFGKRIVDGVLFPLVALAFAYTALRVFQYAAPGTLLPVLRIALPILLSLVVVRVSVRVLSATFAASAWVLALERSITWLAWLALVLWVTGVLPMLLEGAEAVEFSLGSTRVTLRNLVEGSVSAGVVLVIALWISAAIERKLIHGTGNDLSMRKMAANLVRAVLLTAGLLIALSVVGIDLTALSVLGGALGVGLGFGLQRIAANYVGGFVILAERAVRVGDMVKIDAFEGRVTDIRARYTVVRAISGRESIVPNEMFISQRVENLSFTDTRVLVQSAVSVVYGTDVTLLREKLQAAMAAVPRVIADPAPAVQIGSFGLYGIDLTLNFWIVDPENGQGNVRSDLNFAVLALLQQEGIEIPRAQLVVESRAAAQASRVGPPAIGNDPSGRNEVAA